MAIVYICYALLCIPFLNLLVGMLVGLMFAGKLLREGRFGRLLLGLPLAALWTGSAFVLCAAVIDRPLSSGSIPSWIWGPLWLLVHLALTHGIFVFVGSGGRSGYAKQLALANAAGKGNFTAGCGNYGLLPQLYVDPNAKMLAFVAEKWFRIEPASFIRSTAIDFVAENDGTARDVLLKINTSDFNKPVITIEMASLVEAQAWQQRLQLLHES